LVFFAAPLVSLVSAVPSLRLSPILRVPCIIDAATRPTIASYLSFIQ
jgi:hypothetical protein